MFPCSRQRQLVDRDIHSPVPATLSLSLYIYIYQTVHIEICFLVPATDSTYRDMFSGSCHRQYIQRSISWFLPQTIHIEICFPFLLPQTVNAEMYFPVPAQTVGRYICCVVAIPVHFGGYLYTHFSVCISLFIFEWFVLTY